MEVLRPPFRFFPLLQVATEAEGLPTFSRRFESHPEGAGQHAESAPVRLGPRRVHGLRLAAQRRDSHPAQRPGRGKGHVQVFERERRTLGDRFGSLKWS